MMYVILLIGYVALAYYYFDIKQDIEDITDKYEHLKDAMNVQNEMLYETDARVQHLKRIMKEKEE